MVFAGQSSLWDSNFEKRKFDCPNEWETFLTKKFLGNHNNFRELKKFFLIIQFLNFLWTICRLQFARCLDWEIVCQRIGLFAYLSKAVLLGRRAVHRRRPDSKIKSSWCLRDRRPRANCTATLFAAEKNLLPNSATNNTASAVDSGIRLPIPTSDLHVHKTPVCLSRALLCLVSMKTVARQAAVNAAFLANIRLPKIKFGFIIDMHHLPGALIALGSTVNSLYKCTFACFTSFECSACLFQAFEMIWG